MKKIIAAVLVLTMLFSVIPMQAFAEAEGEPVSINLAGKGTESEPFLIENLVDLEAFRDAVNAGETFEGKYLRLVNDIVMNDVSVFARDEADYIIDIVEGQTPYMWVPIGTEEAVFSGSFDGNQHTIKGIYINEVSTWQGLFGYCTNATVCNLNIGYGLINAGQYSAGVIAYNNAINGESVILGCSNEATSKTQTIGNSGKPATAGGIIGYAYSQEGTISIINCENNGYNYCLNKGYYLFNRGYHFAIGGIVGYANADAGNITIRSCQNNEKIESVSTASSPFGKGDFTGGIVGLNAAVKGVAGVDECINKGNIVGGRDTGRENFYALSSGGTGGIVGGNLTTKAGGIAQINDCQNCGIITGIAYTGGIAGYNAHIIKHCNNASEVSGTEVTGGIVGMVHPDNATAEVNDCYNTATVTGGNNTAGIVGQNAYYGTNTKRVQRCYNTGNILGKTNTGGIVGCNSTSSSVFNCHNAGAVVGEEYTAGIIGKNLGCSLTTCHNTAAITGGEKTAAIINNSGEDLSRANITYCYYLAGCTENGVMNDEKTSYSVKNVNALTSAQMKEQENFAGFDFVDVWEMNSDADYPILTSLNHTYTEQAQLEVRVADERGNELHAGFDIFWYDEAGRLIGSGNVLRGAEENKDYYYEVVLEQSLAFSYFPVARQQVALGETNRFVCTLTSIGTVTVSGTVAGENGKALEGASLRFTQTFADNLEKVTTAQTDENGAYSVELPAVAATLKVSADGYYSHSKTILSTIRENTVPLGQTVLKKLPENKIAISVYKTLSRVEGAAAAVELIESFGGLNFTLFNKTADREIEAFEAVYPNIIIEDSQISAGDLVEITAVQSKGTMRAASVSVTLDEQKMGTARIDFVENGKLRVNAMSGNEENRILIYNENGTLVKEYEAGDRLVTDALEQGHYSAVFMKASDLLSNLRTMERFAEFGLEAETDYTVKEFDIEQGIITVVQSVEVPQFDESKINYTLSQNTSFTANESSVSVGKYVVLRCKFEIDPKYSTSEQTLKFELPENVLLANASVSVDGKSATYSVKSNVLSVPVNRNEGIVRFYIVATDKADVKVNAYLSMKADGTPVIQPLGTATFTAEVGKLVLPEKTGQSEVAVSGTTLANSKVTVFDNGVAVLTTKANAVGSWQGKMPLVKTADYAQHEIYALIESDKIEHPIKTEPQTLIYDKKYIEVSKITMLFSGGSQQKIEFDYFNPSARTPAYTSIGSSATFTFKVEFTGGDDTVLENVYVNAFTGRGKTVQIPVTYDKKTKLWIGSQRLYSSQYPSSVSVGYSFKDTSSKLFGTSQPAAVDVADLSYNPKTVSREEPPLEQNSDFAVYEIDRAKGTFGLITLAIRGNKMPANTRAFLTNDDTSVEASDIYWMHHGLMYATFNMSAAKNGRFSLQLQANGETATLNNCFEIDSSLPAGRADIRVNIADAVQTGEIYKGSVTVTNTGYSDIYAPIILLKGDNLQLKTASEFSEEASVFVPNKEGLAGVIRKGETAHFNFEYKAHDMGEYSLEAKEYTSGNTYINNKTISENSSVEDIIAKNYVDLNGSTNVGQGEKIAKTANIYDSIGVDELSLGGLLLNNIINSNANLGIEILADSVDISTGLLSFNRTYYASLSSRFENKTLGYGWASSFDITADTLKTDDGYNSIIVRSPSSALVFVEINGEYKTLSNEKLTATIKEGIISVSDEQKTAIFNENGKISIVSTENGDYVKYLYNSDGLLKSVSNNYGEGLSFSYLNSKISKVTSTYGDSVTYDYEDDYLVSVNTKYGTVKYSYDTSSVGSKRHSLTRIEKPSGQYLRYLYDNFGRLVQSEDNNSNVKYEYGANNDVTVTNSNNQKVQKYYDSDGNAIKTVIDDDVVVLKTKDLESNTSSLSFNLFDSVKYSYDEHGNVISVEDFDGNSTAYVYDDNNAMTSLTDKGGKVTSYNRNEDGTLASIGYADGSTKKATYDANGNIATVTKCDGTVITYTYDSKDRNTKIEYSTGELISYTYNSRGDVTSVNENGEVTKLHYNNKGDLYEVIYPDNKSITYDYDECGRVIAVTDHNGNKTQYSYDVFDRLKTVSDTNGNLLAQYKYNEDSSLASVTNGNGTYSKYSYENGYLSQIKNYSAEDIALSTFKYQYDEYGYISQMTDNESTWKYEYDKQGQLTKVVSLKGDTAEYAYDLSGNRTSVKTNGQETRYTSNNLNQYTSVGTNALTYDANGNLTSYGEKETYEYDYLDRLVKFTAEDGSVFEYTYDAFGNRNSVTKNGETTQYLVDPTGYGDIIAEYSAKGDKQYIQGNGLVAQINGTNAYYYNFNHLGSTTEITDINGKAVNTYRYDAEGKLTSRQETVSNPFTYVGQYGIADDANGLYYMRARYTSQSTGAFVTPDPAGQNYDTNLYRYANNNYQNYYDLTGYFLQGIQSGISNIFSYIKTAYDLSNAMAGQSFKGGEISQTFKGSNLSGGPSGGDEFIKSTEGTSESGMGGNNPGGEQQGGHNTGRGGNGRGGSSGNSTKGGGGYQASQMVAHGAAGLAGGAVAAVSVGQISATVGSLCLSNGWVVPAIGLTSGPALPLLLAGGAVVGIGIYVARKSMENGQLMGMNQVAFVPFFSPFVLSSKLLLAGAIVQLAKNKNAGSAPKSLRIVVDPSGYVYEAVPSNRLEGVKAEVYYYDYALDEFGIAQENKSDILWDAENYDQINPQYTDADGRYAWDVPEGQWLVKYSKEGYYDTDSRRDVAVDDEGYLPVPPPQTEVNVGMVSKAAPTVESICVYGDEVSVNFSQYMQLDSVNTNTVKVKVNGRSVGGTIEPLNAEYDYENVNRYASSFKFTPEAPLSGAVTVIVENAVNYAGNAMAARFTRSQEAEQRLDSIDVAARVDVAYTSAATIPVQLLPASAGAGKTLHIQSDSPEMVSVVSDTVVTDAQGKAFVSVKGELPGEAQLSIQVENTDIAATVTAHVGGVQNIENECESVEASIANNTVVEKGSAVILSTKTEGASIYYTLDGSSPLEPTNAARQLYTAPITIEQDTLIVAYASKEGFTDSATSAFSYRIKTAPALEGSVEILGTHKAGDVLTASVHLNVGNTEALAYQWYADDIAIEGETNSTYTIKAEDTEKEIKVVLSPTTTEYIGSLCGSVVLDEHFYNQTVTPPTCTQQGYTTYTCVNCGESFVENWTDPLGHQPAQEIHEKEVAASCTQAGSYEAVIYCSVCQQELSRNKVDIPAKEHAYQPKTVVPTATAVGYTRYQCPDCGASYKADFTAPIGKLTLKCAARTANAEKLQWKNIKTAAGYQVQISTKDGKKWDKCYTLKAGVTNVTFKSLAASNAYKFRARFYIKAEDGKNYYSAWSALTSPTLPVGTSLKKLTPAAKAFSAQWKQNKAVSGYQIQYATNAKFTKAKTVTVKSNKTLKATVKKLSAKRVYYVRIRTYKTISKVNYYSAWSKAVKVKTK